MLCFGVPEILIHSHNKILGCRRAVNSQAFKEIMLTSITAVNLKFSSIKVTKYYVKFPKRK